jgi:glycosyltransferase involved in cell wall biosynthesis
MSLPDTPLRGEDVLILSPHPWHPSLDHPAQRLTYSLAAHNGVVFVEPAPRFTSVWKQVLSPSGTSPISSTGHLRRHRTFEGEDVHVFTPPPLLPCPRSSRIPTFSSLDAANGRRVGNALASSLHRLNVTAPVTVCCDTPRAGQWVRAAVSPKVTAYYACSVHPPEAALSGTSPNGFSEAAIGPLTARDARRIDRAFARQADFVVATTTSRLQHYQSDAPSLHLLRPGIDFSLYHRGSGSRPSPARSCVGFIGPFDDSIDAELLRHLGRSLPDVDFLFVGALDDDGPAGTVVDALPNATALGERQRSELPMWLQMMDVGLMPFRSGTCPEKTHSRILTFFASGKPVVALKSTTPADLASLVDTADRYRDLAPRLRSVLARPSLVSRRRERIEAARSYDWSRQIHRFGRLLRLHLPTHPMSRHRCLVNG